MRVKCFRCSRELDTPDASNADYIIAEDTKADESRECFVALKHNEKTLVKAAQMAETETYLAEDGKTELTRPRYPDLTLADSEYDAIEVASVAEAKEDPRTVRIEVRSLMKTIQKTGIVCPDCYKLTDFIIWGMHKK